MSKDPSQISACSYCVIWDLHPKYPLTKFPLRPIARKTHDQIQLWIYALLHCNNSTTEGDRLMHLDWTGINPITEVNHLLW